MDIKPVKLGILFLALLLGALLLFGLRILYEQNTNCQNGKTPIKNYLVAIKANRQESLVEQSRKYASEHGFKFDVVYYTQKHDEFLVDLTRKDIEIIIANSFTQGKFEVSIYNNDCMRPTLSSDIDSLAQDLRASLSKIPDILTIEEK